VELTLDLASQVSSVPRQQLRAWLSDGTAWKKLVALVEAQGGDSTALERILEVHRAPIIRDLRSPAAGRITRMDAGAIGRACVALGAGRAKASDRIDFTVGFSAIRKVGEEVATGEPLLRMHSRSEESLRAVQPDIERAIEII
jgi:thymidine phosphorylase